MNELVKNPLNKPSQEEFETIFAAMERWVKVARDFIPNIPEKQEISEEK